MHRLLPLLVACGAPAHSPTVTSPPPTTPPTTITIRVPATAVSIAYRACTDDGHVSLHRGARSQLFRLAFDADRDRSATDATLGGIAWRVGTSHDGDLSQDLTIDGRHRDEQPQLWARADGLLPIFVATTGLDRSERDDVLARLAEPGTHRIGPLNLHVTAAFDGIDLFSSTPDATVPRLPSEHYGARFARATQWVQQAPWRTFAGAQFWFAPYAQPTDDHVGLPTIPAWHGEAAIDGLVLEIDATGTSITEAQYLAFAEDVIRAARTTSNACRTRSGHMGTP